MESTRTGAGNDFDDLRRAMKEWAPPPESTWALQRPAQRRVFISEAVAPRVEGLERQNIRTMQGLVLPRSAHALGQLGLQTVEAPVHGVLPCSGRGDLQGGEVPESASSGAPALTQQNLRADGCQQRVCR